MTHKAKIAQQFLKDPKSVRYLQLVEILESYGFTKVSTKGSHVKFKHPQIETDLIIPVHDSECKDFYKKQALKIIKKL
jgi:predicted RNA binding protein YcfA (HicA-like mRNA interferase family)